MTDTQPISPDAFAALQKNFQMQSRKAQAYYTAMHAMSKVLNSEAAANAWMEQPLAALDGKSPAQVIAAGNAQQVHAYIQTLGA